MDLLDQLRVFLRVAHGGGFSAAAEQLDMPRPTVSLAVQRLEARLGARLFSRTTRRVSLTADGQALLERAAVLLADAQELEQQFRPQGAALSGRLRVDLPSRIARRLVAPALPDFFERHPGVTLELGSSDRAIDLVQEGVDCALRVGELASSSLVARPLGQLAVVTCASPGYLQRHGVPRHPDELPRHQAVQYAATAGGRPAPWEWLEQGQLHGKAMPGRVTVGNAETYIACALAGLGLIQVPAYDVQEHLASGALVQVLGDCAQPGMAVHLVVSHRRHLSARVQAFGSWLAGVLEPHFRVAAAPSLELVASDAIYGAAADCAAPFSAAGSACGYSLFKTPRCQLRLTIGRRAA